MTAGRKKTTSIFLKGKTYYCHFHPYGIDKRKKVTLKTREKSIADYYRNEIQRLSEHHITPAEAEAQDIHKYVYFIFYGKERVFVEPPKKMLVEYESKVKDLEDDDQGPWIRALAKELEDTKAERDSLFTGRGHYSIDGHLLYVVMMLFR